MDPRATHWVHATTILAALIMYLSCVAATVYHVMNRNMGTATFFLALAICSLFVTLVNYCMLKRNDE